MKLVVLTNILTPYRIPLFEALQHRVKDFTVLLMARHEENRRWRLAPHSFKMQVLPGIHIRPPGFLISVHLNYGVIKALRKLDPDVVVSGGFGIANISAWIYCRLFRKRFIGWGELTMTDCATTSVIRRAIRQCLIRYSDGVIASSRVARDAFLHYGAREDRLLTAVMPIEVSYFQRQTEAFRQSEECKRLRGEYSGPILLSIGQLIRRKGYLELFKIYEQIVKRRPDVELLIIGEGPERPLYEKIVQEKGWANVHFIGYVQKEELSKYFAAADLFVFHTLSDSFGAVLSEAMAAGVPSVSSVHAAATHDLIEEGLTGFKFDPKDIESSAEAILKALEMSVVAKKVMVKTAYERVKQFDIEVSAEEMIRFIERVSDSGRSGAMDLRSDRTLNRVEEKNG
ncbi:MAG: glycosyltransferase family 4 protein [Candidatus Manganitrophus sp. SB1]|nr:glycosyltransferase family 4 protein [Candidatus Manganitrophus morganii]